MKKIILLRELKKFIAEISDKKKVLAGGCFDILHYGHLTFLEKAKQAGNFLIVVLESDEFIIKHKRRKPVHNQNQRAQILAALECVDLVVKIPLFKSDAQYQKLVELIKPAIIAVTENDGLIEKKRQQAISVGGKLKIVTNLLNGFSTKKIIRLLQLEI